MLRVKSKLQLLRSDLRENKSGLAIKEIRKRPAEGTQVEGRILIQETLECLYAK